MQTKKNITYLRLLFLFIFCNSCKNELEVNAPYKETIIIYALLENSSNTQYIRVGKGFQNANGDAYLSTKISDSIYFDSAQVTVRNLQTNQLYYFTKTYAINKDSGVFSNNPNVLYEANFIPNPLNTYKVEVKTQTMNEAAYATTEIVKTPQVISPVNPFSKVFSCVPSSTLNMQFKTNPGKFAYAYDVELTFEYYEFPKSDTSNKTLKQITLPLFRNSLVQDPNSSFPTPIFNTFQCLAFYQFLSNTIKEDITLGRKALYVHLNYYGAGKELYNYISVNQPSIGIIQKNTDYTNVTNGIGIVSSRHIFKIQNIPFDGNTNFQIINNSLTKKLNFN